MNVASKHTFYATTLMFRGEEQWNGGDKTT